MRCQLIAMHGWAGDGRSWKAWATAAASRDWGWQAADRGYGSAPIQQVAWPDEEGRRVLIAHSLGPHLISDAVLAQAEAVVLLASFGAFVPPGRAGRRLQTALNGMASALEGDQAEEMLETFLQQAAGPEPISALPSTILAAPLSSEGRSRLLQDLRLLAGTTGLPKALSTEIPCLLVEAGRDGIVVPEARALLRQERPQASVIHYEQAGHCLLNTTVVRDVMTWIASL